MANLRLFGTLFCLLHCASCVCGETLGKIRSSQNGASRRTMKEFKEIPSEGTQVVNPVIRPGRRDRCGDCKPDGEQWCTPNGQIFNSKCRARCTLLQPIRKCDGNTQNPPPMCGVGTRDCVARAGEPPIKTNPGCATCPYPSFQRLSPIIARELFPNVKYPVCALLQAQCSALCEDLKTRHFFTPGSEFLRPGPAAEKWSKCIQGCFGIDKAPCPNAVRVAFKVGESPYCKTAPSEFCGSPFKDKYGVLRAFSIRQAFAPFILKNIA